MTVGGRPGAIFNTRPRAPQRFDCRVLAAIVLLALCGQSRQHCQAATVADCLGGAIRMARVELLFGAPRAQQSPKPSGNSSSTAK